MKHYIIAKFKETIDWKKMVPEITAHFEPAKAINGISGVTVHPSCSEKANRFHIMIEMLMSPEGLKNWDQSSVHHEWKSKYGEMLEGKTIFDCEE